MKELFKKINSIYHSHNIDFYCSLLGPLTMFIIHLISVMMHFEWLTFNYALFFLLMIFIKTFLFFDEKYDWKINTYLVAAISTVFLSIPMMVSFILTILYRDAPSYIFEWLIYAYALYATIKIVVAIRKRIKAKYGETERTYVSSWIGLVGALYTLQMLEFRLIKFVEGDNVSDQMYMMQLFTQGLIFLFAVFVVILFVYRFMNNKKTADLQ